MEIREQKMKRRTRPKPRDNTQIVYTQPRPFNRRRFILRMLTVLAIVLAVVFGMSIFFKVKTVTVTGSEKYTAWEIREASGISDDDHLLTLNKAHICGRIRARLPYVDEIRIGIKLPDIVNIEITELQVVYAIQDAAQDWWLVDAEGRIIEKTAAAGTYTKILGVTLDGPKAGQQAKALEPENGTATTSGSSDQTQTEPPVTEFAAQKLNVALQILQDLEKNGVLGTMVSVDVSELLAVELWYADQYQILLGDSSKNLSYKVEAMSKAIEQMGSYQRGTLDVSFTTWPDQVGYTPFS